MSNFAPVFIPTLCRYEHFKRCVESLANCTHADKTDLIIALDYPLKDSHWDGYKKIEAYLTDIKGFASVNVIKRNENYGAVRNIFETKKELFERYDRLIFSEDDNEFSPNFLDYLNKGLEKFKDDPRIYAICGYNYPIVMPEDYKYNYFLGKAFSAWGYGIWKKQYEVFKKDFTYSDVVRKLNNTKEAFKVFDNINSLLKIAKDRQLCGDVIISSGLTLRNMRCVFPAVTKVRNHGHDGSGVNCGVASNKELFIAQPLDDANSFAFSHAPDKDSMKVIEKLLSIYYKTSFSVKCRTLIKYILYRIS